MIRRNFLARSLASLAAFFAGSKCVEADLIQGEDPLRKIMRDSQQVGMKDLRKGDVFTMDDLDGYWEATSNPYVMEFGGGMSPWGIEAIEFIPPADGDTYLFKTMPKTVDEFAAGKIKGA